MADLRRPPFGNHDAFRIVSVTFFVSGRMIYTMNQTKTFKLGFTDDVLPWI